MGMSKAGLEWGGGAAGRGCLDEMDEMDVIRRIQLGEDDALDEMSI
jgi:hypothetical protein